MAILEKKKQEEFVLQQKRDDAQRKHEQRIAQIEDQIARERDILRDAQLVEEREQAILQKKKDLQDVAQLAAQAAQASQPSLLRVASPAPTGVKSPPSMNTASTQPVVPQEKSATPSTSVQATTSRGNGKAADVKPLTPKPPKSSAARERWQRQKDLEGASNDAIDAIMAMTGLEEVKEQVLRIKDKVETSQLQGSSVKGERFNICMLGNPGTGKTTVARLYGKFLASVQVIPGNMFVETTGSSLANDGVSGMKKLLDNVVNGGGGTIFVDEAYQLASQSNFQGSQVLDFLLAELENQVGKIVFVFAGYKFSPRAPGLGAGDRGRGSTSRLR